MKTTRFYILLLFLGAIFSCIKFKELATLTTNDTSNPTINSVTSGGNITNGGSADITARGVCWSTSQSPTTAGSHTTDGTGTGSFTSSITGLDPDTKYYIRAYATNSAGTAYGNEVSFRTIALTAPTLTTFTATEIGPTTAKSGGTISSDGGAPITAKGVCWSTSTNPTTDGSKTSDGSGSDAFVSNVTGLIPGTTYYYRAYATNSVETAYGNELTFITRCIAASVTTNAFTGVGSTTATLNGIVNANSFSTTVTFEYGTTTSYGSTISATPGTVNGSNNTSVSASISSLTSGMLYHYRVKGVNCGGTTNGVDLTFTTTQLLYDNDGNSYNTVKIGTQLWMAENLKTTKYNNGTDIDYGWVLDPANNDWDFPTTAGYCWYNNDESYKNPNGALYNWLTVNTGMLCPDGWHVPTSDEWNLFRDYLFNNRQTFADGSYDVAKSIASTSGWEIPLQSQRYVPDGVVGKDQSTNNRTGFNGYPSGMRSWADYFINIGTAAIWWSATGPDNPWDFSITNGSLGSSDIQQGSDYQRNGFSVRCIKN